jgi:hypothetical protein
MRTSFNILSTSYIQKKNEENEQVNIVNKTIEKITKRDKKQKFDAAIATGSKSIFKRIL